MAGSLVWAAVFSVLAIDRHESFRSHRFDLGNMVQAIWSTAHGHFLETTQSSGAETSRLAVHTDVLLAAFAPAWWAYPRPECLLVLQAVALALGALPLFLLARKHTRSTVSGVLFAGAYLLYPSVQWNTLNDFHTIAIGSTLLLYAIWYLDEDRLVPFAVFALLAATAEEQVGFLLAGLGVWYSFSARRRAAGSAIAVLSAGWSATAILVIIPHFSVSGHSPYYGRYENIGGSPSGIVRTAFSHPLRLIDAATSASDIKYLIALLLPLAGLWAGAPLLAAAALPQLALNLLSSFWSMNRVEYQYVCGILPFLFAASAIGAGRLRGRTHKASLVVLALCTLAGLALGPWSLKDSFVYADPPSAQHLKALRRAVELIPGGAAVSSTNQIGAHLSARRYIYSFPTLGRAKWIVIDETDSWLATIERNDVRVFSRDVAAIRGDPLWRTILSDNRVLVLTKRS